MFSIDYSTDEFKSIHLSCSDDGRLRLHQLPNAQLLDTFDHDFGTVLDPAWPDELGKLPEWFWPEVIEVYRMWRDNSQGGTA